MSRAEEYERRMRALGWQNSLAGMDDDDIEEALARLDGRRAAEPEQAGTGFVKIRPGVDRDFAERMFKMFARPFDPNWKMPALDGPGYYKKSWPYVMSNTAGYEPGGNDTGAGMRQMKGDVTGGGGNTTWEEGIVKYTNTANSGGGDDRRAAKEVPTDTGGTDSQALSTQNADVWGTLKSAVNVQKYWEEVYKEARENHKMEHEEAVRKANEAAILYTGYLGGATVATSAVTAVTKNPKYGAQLGGLTGFLGWSNIDNTKKWIKDKVFEPYNPKWDGTTSD